MTDEEVLLDYWRVMEQKPIEDPAIKEALVRMVKRCRQEEPRINCGAHLVDYINICDDDDNMDSFYGPNYFNP